MKKDKNQNAYQEGFCFACSGKKIPAKIQKAYEKVNNGLITGCWDITMEPSRGQNCDIAGNKQFPKF